MLSMTILHYLFKHTFNLQYKKIFNPKIFDALSSPYAFQKTNHVYKISTQQVSELNMCESCNLFRKSCNI